MSFGAARGEKESDPFGVGRGLIGVRGFCPRLLTVFPFGEFGRGRAWRGGIWLRAKFLRGPFSLPGNEHVEIPILRATAGR